MTVDELLASPVGQEAFQVMYPGCAPSHDAWKLMFPRFAAALDVLLSDVCPTCGGRGVRTPPGTKWSPLGPIEPCSDCNNGKVKPALPTWERTKQLVTAARKASVEAADLMREEHRAEVIEEVKGWIADGGGWHDEQCDESALEHIERREREGGDDAR